MPTHGPSRWQQGELGFDICACSVPAQESIHGKTVPKVLNPWRLSFGSDDTAFLKQGVMERRKHVPLYAPPPHEEFQMSAVSEERALSALFGHINSGQSHRQHPC